MTGLIGVLIFFFFFQAEDGIRDWSVTGVQTCALPIYQFLPGFYQHPRAGSLIPNSASTRGTGLQARQCGAQRSRDRQRPARDAVDEDMRSEERRVGEEGRIRGGGGT